MKTTALAALLLSPGLSLRAPFDSGVLVAALAGSTPLTTSQGKQDAPADAAAADFFEKKIRPVLVEKCYKCHSHEAQKLKGNLHLDGRDSALKGGDRGPALVPGDPDRSLLIKAIRWADEDVQMPPKQKLPAAVIADFEAWVRAGAPFPAAAKAAGRAEAIAAAARQHWAFQPPKEHPVPPKANHPVDAFLLAKLEEKGLRLSPPADRRTLLRRATYDLVGLPPTAEEVDAFERDAAPDAFERALDRLLADPRYGERWGRHWLDVARYADTKGYVYEDREEARFVHSADYRDWVIRAFNDDLPFDRFLMLQVAGDRLAQDRRDLRAMGFLTVGRRFINNVHDIIDDRIDTLTRGMMALTVSCARCHDHKFDPIPTADYYALYGVFHGSSERLLPVAESPERTDATAAYEAELKKRQDTFEKNYKAKTEKLLERLRSKAAAYIAAVLEVEKYPTEEFYMILGADDLLPFVIRRWHSYILSTAHGFHPVWAPWHAFNALPERDLASRAPEWVEANRPKLHPKVAAIFSTPPAGMKDVAQRYGKLFAEVYKQPDSDAALREVLYGAGSPIAAPRGHFSEVEWFFEESARQELGKQHREVERWILQSEAAPPHASILEDKPLQQNPRVFRRGNPANKGEEVPRRLLTLLGGNVFSDGSGRLELAKAIASPDNPLTARVWVNRVWGHHFDRPIVGTPSDFGLRSDRPTHPELLDWLAVWFVRNGWSTKALHKLLMTSAAYRQSSRDDPAARAVDSENRLLWRANRRRLDLEQLRDTLLWMSGQLDPRMGGKTVPLTSRRRTVYAFIDRLNVPSMLRTFDFASVDAHGARRHQTTVPQQALFMMNSPFVLDQARALARQAKDVPSLYRRLYQREPTAGEAALSERLTAAPIAEPVKVKPSAWQYGYGEYDAAAESVKNFTALPHYTGSSWQGGPALPDPGTGWVYLNAQGGHAGNDARHAAVRRWVAPSDASLTVSGTVVHKNTRGDGVRARLVSSRSGLLASWTVRQMEAEMKIKGVEVKKGDTLDFVVDCRKNITDDEFTWAPVIKVTPAPAATAENPPPGAEWNAAKEFTGPPPAPLTPFEKYVQTLLLTNELLFLD